MSDTEGLQSRRQKRNFLATRRTAAYAKGLRVAMVPHEPGSKTVDTVAEQVALLTAQVTALQGVVLKGDGDQFEDADVPSDFPIRAEPDPPDLLDDATDDGGEPNSTTGVVTDTGAPTDTSNETDTQVGEAAATEDAPVSTSSDAGGGISADGLEVNGVSDDAVSMVGAAAVTGQETDSAETDATAETSGDATADAVSLHASGGDVDATAEAGDTGSEVVPPVGSADSDNAEVATGEAAAQADAATSTSVEDGTEPAVGEAVDTEIEEGFVALEENYDPAKKHIYPTHVDMKADVASQDADHLLIVESDENYGGKRMHFWAPSDGTHLPLKPKQRPGGAFSHD